MDDPGRLTLSSLTSLAAAPSPSLGKHGDSLRDIFSRDSLRDSFARDSLRDSFARDSFRDPLGFSSRDFSPEHTGLTGLTGLSGLSGLENVQSSPGSSPFRCGIFGPGATDTPPSNGSKNDFNQLQLPQSNLFL